MNTRHRMNILRDETVRASIGECVRVALEEHIRLELRNVQAPAQEKAEGAAKLLAMMYPAAMEAAMAELAEHVGHWDTGHSGGAPQGSADANPWRLAGGCEDD